MKDTLFLELQSRNVFPKCSPTSEMNPSVKHPQFEIIDHAHLLGAFFATADKLAQTEPALVHTISSKKKQHFH